jgi:restriction system protein
MARKVNLFNLALKVGRAVAADQRRAQNAAIRNHNAEIRRQNQIAKQDERNFKQAERERIANQKAAHRERLLHEKNRLREQTASEKTRQKEEALRFKEEALRFKEEQKQEALRYINEQKQDGIERNNEAKAEIDILKNTLSYTLKINDAIDWSQFKDTAKFKESPPKLELPPSPENQPIPISPTPEIVPLKPSPTVSKPNPPEKNAVKYQPVFGFMDKLVTSRRAIKIAEAESLFQQDHAVWVAECTSLDEHNASELRKWEDRKKSIENKNAALHADWERAVERTKTENTGRISWWGKNCEQIRAKHGDAMKEWEQRKEKFYEDQKEINAAIDMRRESYMSREQEAVADYCDAVLSNSIYPDYFPKEWDMDYNAATRTLVVEYALPAPEALPTLKEVQYIQSKDNYKETHLSEKEREAIYDSLLYQMALRTIHELFESDTADALDAVAFSGIVTALEKTTGHDVTACVLSVLARKEPFMQINLAGIDPKACFKSLKGVAASKLTGLTPVYPVMMLDKDDRRFTAGYGVTEYINEGTNLATMDWEDFEHLIREVFEQEFASGGGEVKVTQASRDGGVDAVAFDPDPIRGGKIVIQAKRYANTVGVSAVRDLYGTVMNEGAIKGLLVTTADYGPDAYEFAKGKPLSLLNGSNLLYLLEKHGHQARINLHEAKQENKQAFEAGITRKRNLPLE